MLIFYEKLQQHIINYIRYLILPFILLTTWFAKSIEIHIDLFSFSFISYADQTKWKCLCVNRETPLEGREKISD